MFVLVFFFSSRRRHTRCGRDWSSDVCSSDLVGLGLVFGCLTSLAGAIGLVLVVNYGLAVQWQGSAQQGFHYMLITTLVVILGARAGRVWGVDGWARAHRPGWWLARVRLG